MGTYYSIKGNGYTKAIFLLVIIALSWNCSSPSVEYICKHQKHGIYTEVYLISHHPRHEKKIKELITEHVEKIDTLARETQRVYLKEHDNSMFDLGLGEDIDYRTSECGDIDIVDVVCNVWNKKHVDGPYLLWYNFHFPLAE